MAMRIFLALAISVCVVATTGRSGDNTCSYSFQVWKPDQDALWKLERLDLKQRNQSMHFNTELLRLRNDVLHELLASKNISHSIEKQVMEQRLENVKLRMQQQELKMTIMNVKERNDEIKNMMQGGSRGSAPRQQLGGDGTMQNEGQIKTEVGTLQAETARLQNGIGDLKAEWLLIKREIQELRNGGRKTNNNAGGIETDLEQLRNMMQDVQEDTLLLKKQQNSLKNQNSQLHDMLSKMQNANDEYRQFQSRMRKSTSKIQEQLHEMRFENSDLQKELHTLRSTNRQLSDRLGESAPNITRPFSRKSVYPDIKSETQSDRAASLTRSIDAPRDCDEIYRRGYSISGVYKIRPGMSSQLDDVYCEMFNGSGWTVLQRRVDGLQKFNRRWLEYKYGFGNLYGEFWIGNEKLHNLTNQKTYVLRIDMWDWEGKRYYAEYDHFLVESDTEKYRLHVSKYHGDAGDSLSYHNDMAFSTGDTDNDLHPRNCAGENQGGWWYNKCYTSNLNGVYRTSWYSRGGKKFSDGIVWYTLKESDLYSLRKVEMKIRPKPYSDRN